MRRKKWMRNITKRSVRSHWMNLRGQKKNEEQKMTLNSTWTNRNMVSEWQIGELILQRQWWIKLTICLKSLVLLHKWFLRYITSVSDTPCFYFPRLSLWPSFLLFHPLPYRQLIHSHSFNVNLYVHNSLIPHLYPASVCLLTSSPLMG